MTSDELRTAVEEAVRGQLSPSHVVTDWVVVAASVDMAEGPGRVAYTTLSEGAPHAIGGLLDCADLGDMMEGDDGP